MVFILHYISTKSSNLINSYIFDFQETDQLIQRTLRQKFSDCTVLTIAHRINTIIDSDRIMVIDEGKLVDFDHAAVLLQRPECIFYDLVKETGMFDLLLQQAKLVHNNQLPI